MDRHIQTIAVTAVALLALSVNARAADIPYISGGVGADEREAFAAKERDYNLKIIEFAHANTNTAFDFAQDLMEVKHPSELIALSTAHVQKRFETMIAQTKELTELAQKVTTEATAPLRAGVTKALKTKVA